MYDCFKPVAVHALLDSHLPANVGEVATKFAKLNRPVLVDITRLDKVRDLLLGRILTQFLQHCLQFTACYVSILVHIEFIEGHLEGRSFIISDLCCLL